MDFKNRNQMSKIDTDINNHQKSVQKDSQNTTMRKNQEKSGQMSKRSEKSL